MRGQKQLGVSGMTRIPTQLENYWKKEEQFTEWLSRETQRNDIDSDPVDELELAVGLSLFDLEHQAKKDNGKFRPDIETTGYDGDTYRNVVIEVQQRDRDSATQKHFGKLLIYGQAAESDLIIWVVPSGIHNRYYQTLAWLEKTTGIDFQVVQAEMLVNDDTRIDFDRKYPHAGPETIPDSKTAQRQRRFWAGFVTYIDECDTPLVNGYTASGKVRYPQGGNLTDPKGISISFGMPATSDTAYCRVDIDREDAADVVADLTTEDQGIPTVTVDRWEIDKVAGKIVAKRTDSRLDVPANWDDCYSWFRTTGEQIAQRINETMA